ncbi:hypothetical protein FZI91_08680 [Mycobacterium sp. CBMA271]|uniref:DUF6545 domain-containing protein n=1 Tax=unclassified Mycobacteroides TaxID=2618759 RepID=UPI0012DCA440|nr:MULTISPECIES: DUF6545 domain-containing protein [unclassified Mycobacteroides]MUM15511.1 hypothetical protein [Mycobacteroides sp. CBMA 326]MUM21777.1 hypothetical protein [Mycobacteroides sp. CBMA 271]
MTSSVPAWIAWPLIAAMAAVIALRYKWFNKTLYDNYFNNTLLLMFMAQLLREHAVEQLLKRAAVMTVTMAQHLSLVLVFFMAAEFMGFITLWARLSPEETRRRHRYHRGGALILAAAFFLVTTRARASDQLLEVAGGWDNVIAWGLYAVLPVALAAQMLNMCVHEFRRPEARPRERLVAGSIGTIGAAIGTTTLIAMALEFLEEIGWVHSLDYRLDKHAYIFFWEATGAAAVAAIPIALAAVAHLGWDTHSRDWRQLQQLRADMTEAVPDSAFEIAINSPARRKTALELHQTTVQIRDAILRLRPHSTDLSPECLDRFLRKYAVPPEQKTEAAYALQLAAAARAKESGVQPSAAGSQIVQSRSTTLAEETDELLALSRWWQPARAYISLLAAAQPELTTPERKGEQR